MVNIDIEFHPPKAIFFYSLANSTMYSWYFLKELD